MTLLNRKGRRILICVRGNCAEPEQGKRLEKQLFSLIEKHGLDDEDHPQHVTCTLTNCLGICRDGPVMIIHPDAIKYQHLTGASLEQIFHSHILGNEPIEALIVPVK